MSKADWILVIDSCTQYRALLDEHLTRGGYQVVLAPDGLTGLTRLDRAAADLVILDAELPDVDAYALCRHLRDYRSVPIIILTRNANEFDIVRGLQSGADACISKLVGVGELLARVEAVLRRRRAPPQPPPGPLICGDVVIDTVRQAVTVRGRKVSLGTREYQLLYHLGLNAGHVLGHEELLRRVWGPGYESDIGLLHGTVRRLRGKMEEEPASPRYVITRPSIGYLLATPPACP